LDDVWEGSDLFDSLLGGRAKDFRREGCAMMNTKKHLVVNYRFMIVFTLIVGVVGILLLLIPDFELLSFMLTVGALGGLVGGSTGYEERDQQLLEKSYKKVFEWLFLFTLAASAFLALSRWFVIPGGAVTFLNDHWPGLIISVMCILMGIAGFQRKIHVGSA
jgi:hypothetical protein